MPGEVLTYNNVPLSIIVQKEISRTHIFTDDGTTYLYTRWVFDVKTYLNPQALSYIQGTLNQGTSSLPGVTDFVIRKLLNSPRKPLVFSQNGAIVLVTPSPGFPTDCKNGPIVESFDLIQDWGTKTWFVFIRLVAHIRECPIRFKPGTPGTDPSNVLFDADGNLLPDKQAVPPTPPSVDPASALISNRWTRRMETDEDYLSYVETTGECVFDSSILRLTGTFPDQYRLDLFQPIPPNCKRDNISVVQLSDGCTFRYSFRDQERHFNTLPATRVECYQTEGFSQMNQGSALAQAITGGVQSALQASLNVQTPLAALGIAAGTTGAIGFNTILYQVPKFHSHILVRVWGNRNQNKMVLMEQAVQMAFERVATTRFVEFIITFDRVGKYVQVELTNRSGQEEIIPLALYYANFIPQAIDAAQSVPIIRATSDFIGQQIENVQAFFQNRPPANIAAIVPNAPPRILPVPVNESINRIIENFNDGEDSPNAFYDQDENVTQQAYVTRTLDPFAAGSISGPGQYYGNQQPPNANYTRGTILCNLIAQSLFSPCQLPPCPPPVYGGQGVPIQYPGIRTCLDFDPTAVQPTGIQPAPTPPPAQPLPPAEPVPPNIQPPNDPDFGLLPLSEARL